MSIDTFKTIGKTILATAMVTALGAAGMSAEARGPAVGAFPGQSIGKGAITSISEGNGGDSTRSPRDRRRTTTQDRNGGDR